MSKYTISISPTSSGDYTYVVHTPEREALHFWVLRDAIAQYPSATLARKLQVPAYMLRKLETATGLRYYSKNYHRPDRCQRMWNTGNAKPWAVCLNGFAPREVLSWLRARLRERDDYEVMAAMLLAGIGPEKCRATAEN